MSRILLVTPYFHPERTGISVTATDTAYFCRDLGHDVLVVTALPFFPQMRIWDEYKGRWMCRERLNGVRVERVWLYVPRDDSTLKRILHAASFSCTAAFRAMFLPCDVMICTVPFLPTAMLMGLLAHLRRKSIWLTVKDLEIDAAVKLSFLRGAMAEHTARLIERWTYRLADKVLAVSPKILERLQERGVEASKLQLVPDAVDARGEFSRGRERSARQHYFEECGVQGKIVFVHAGAMSAKHDLDAVVEAGQLLLEEQRVFFAIFGEGIEERHIRRKITDSRLTNIGVFPLCERDQFAWMLASADVGILSMHLCAANATFPSKILSYAAAGVPILAAVDGDSEAAAVIREHGLGMVVAAESPTQLAQGVRQLADNRAMRVQMGENGRRFALEHFDHETVKQKYYRPLLS